MQQRLRSIFRDDVFWGPAFALFAGVLAFLKGMRLPNLWSMTQAQMDYSGGFTKRALFGEVMGLLHVHSYLGLACISYLLLLVACMLLWRYAWSTGVAGDIRHGVLVAIFFSGFCFTYLVSLVGYLDIALLCLMLVFLQIDKPLLRLVFGLAAVVCGVLVHEIFLLMFFPLMLLPDVLQACNAGRLRPLVTPALLSVFAVVAACLVAKTPTFSPLAVIALRQRMIHMVDFPLRFDVLDVLTRTTGDNLQIMADYRTQSVWWLDQLWSAIVFLPCAAVFVWRALKMLSGLSGRYELAARAAVVTCTFCPLLLHLLAWDVYRWWAWMGVDAFLVMLAVKRALGPQAPTTAATAWKNAGVLLVCMNLVSGVGLLNHYRVNTAPYDELLMQGVDTLDKHQLTIPGQ